MRAESRFRLKPFGWALGLVLLLGVGMAAAQNTLLVGEEASGKITRSASQVRFALGLNGSETLDIQVRVSEGDLIPWFRVLDDRASEIGRVTNPAASTTLSGLVFIPEPGLYTLEVGGQDDTTGTFSLVVYLGPSVPGAIVLHAGDSVAGAVSAATPEQVYDINSVTTHPLFVLVRSTTTGDIGPDVTLRNEIIDQPLGMGSGLLAGTVFILQPGDSLYSLRVRQHADAEAEQTYDICVVLAEQAADCLASPGAVAAG
jgi:hypothetical protein